MNYKKTLATVAGIASGALLLAAVVVPTSAQAQETSIEALLAQIEALQAQLEALQGGGSTSGSASIVAAPAQPLSMGDRGPAVTTLQTFLIANGHTIPAGATGYFGAQTKAALTSYQQDKGWNGPYGYYGPLTQSWINADIAAASDDDGGDDGSDDGSDDGDDGDDEGELEGGAGSIESTDDISSFNNEEVGEGENDVQVAGVEVEVSDESDIRLTAVKLTFNEGTADRDFDRYADEVSLWLDGDEVARVDADEFTDDNNWSRTVTLDSSAIIRSGDTENLVVAVSGVTNLDSNDESETWTVDFESIRFRDALGASITETITFTPVTFSFEDFATAANVSLRIEEDDESVNDAHVITVDSDNDTDDKSLLSFTMEARGNSDITIDDMPVTFTAVGSDVDHIINSISLWIDGVEEDSESVASSATTTSVLTFSDFDYTIPAGETVSVLVKADFNDLDANFTEGDTILAAFGETETDYSTFDAEDEEGNDLVDADKIGSATSEAHVAYENSFEISNVSHTEVSQDTSNTAVDVKGVYTLTFDVKAVGGASVYLATTTASTTGSANGVEWSVTGDTFTGNGSSDFTSKTASKVASDGAFKINAGQTKTFTLKVTLDNATGTSGFYGFEVDRILFADSEDTGFAETAAYLGDISNYTAVTVGIDELESDRLDLNGA